MVINKQKTKDQQTAGVLSQGSRGPRWLCASPVTLCPDTPASLLEAHRPTSVLMRGEWTQPISAVAAPCFPLLGRAFCEALSWESDRRAARRETEVSPGFITSDSQKMNASVFKGLGLLAS